MIKRHAWIIGGIALMILIYAPIIIAKKESTECDQVVFLEGELSLDVRDVDSYESGMSVLKLCDGTTMSVPTSRIVKVVDKENDQ